MNYKQYRAHFAEKAWDVMLNNGIIDDDGQHQKLKPEPMARIAVAYGDALIAELELTDPGEPCVAPEPEPSERRQLSKESLRAIFDSMPNGVGGFCTDWGWLTFARKVEAAHGITSLPLPAPTPPAPALPRLNTGWKWAAKDGTHKITHFDIWFKDDGRLTNALEIGGVCRMEGLATPDWHNPEGIAEPGEGWRFLVKGERKEGATDEYNEGGRWYNVSRNGKSYPDITYRTPATRPLPPVLADEKEGQP